MRKLAFVFFTLVAVSFVSCGWKTQSSDNVVATDSVSGDSVADEAVVAEDTVKTENISVKKKLGCWKYESQVAYPVEGSEALLASIRKWISESLRVSEDPERKTVAYSGSMDQGKSMLEFYAKEFIGSINYDDYVELPEEMECEMDFTITKEFENSDVVSFNLQTYWFGGGAHGGTTIQGATFRKSDGKQLGWDMLASKKAMKGEIVAGLKKFLEVKTDKELMESLLLPVETDVDQLSTKDIPYPQTAPWISGEGLVLMYQQYEICSYAQGMPVIVIPWNKLGKYLSNDCKSFHK